MLQHFKQYYLSPDDQKIISETQYSITSLRQAVQAVDYVFKSDITNTLSKVKGNKIGLLLSGGVDSSLLLAMLRQLTDKEIVCFTCLTDKDDSDYNPSKEVARKFNVKWVKCLLTKKEVESRLPTILKLSKGGLYDTAANLALDICMDYCHSEGIDNLWTGNGLDMFFGGGANFLEVGRLSTKTQTSARGC